MQPILIILVILLAVIQGSAETNTVHTNAPSAHADSRLTISTLSGVTYTNCRINRVEPDGISIMTRRGVTKIPFGDLSDEYKTKYGYNAEQVESYRRGMAERREKTLALQQALQQEKARQEQAQQKEKLSTMPPFAGDVSVKDAISKITQLDGKVVGLIFKAIGPIIDFEGGYSVRLYGRLYTDDNQLNIPAVFPAQGRAWLGTLRQGRIGVGMTSDLSAATRDELDDKALKPQRVYGILRTQGAIVLEPLGTRRSGDKYSW